MKTSEKNVEQVPVLKKNEVWQYRVLVVLWIVANLFFWPWWLRSESVGSPVLFALMSVAFAYETTILPSFYLFYLGQMRRPKPMKVVPGDGTIGRVAMITLTVPGSESLEIVRRQLVAMTKVSFPHDSWILVDKIHSPEIKALAESLGVKYFSRHDQAEWGDDKVASWNQPIPPFKAKTKAGNVNAWIDAHGQRYSHFTQLDIDHVPEEKYLDEVLGYFQDDKVAWVQAPSVYGNLGEWTARGSAEQELVLQGPLQSGFYGFCKTPFIIGSHCTYRMSAIQGIGGFQPTRAEDHLDTVFLAAGGWQGVYVPEVIATGDGPENFETYMAQQFAWAYSMIQVLFSYTPRCIGNYTPRQAIQFLFAQTWYTLWSVSMLLMFCLPVVGLIVNQPIASVAFASFIIRSLPLTATAFGVWLWSRRWHNPKGVGLSWRGIVLHIARWPVVLSALIQVILKVEKPYMITQKGVQQGELRPFTLKPYLPYLFLILVCLISCWVYLEIYGQGAVQGYLLFVLQGATTVFLVYAVALVKDLTGMIKEGVRFSRTVKLRARGILLTVCLLLAISITGYASAGRIAEAITYNQEEASGNAQSQAFVGVVDGWNFLVGLCSTPIDSPGQEPVATIAAAVPVRTETPTVVPTLTAIPTPTPTTIPTAELPYNRMFVGVYDWDRVFDELSMDVEHDFISWDQPEKISQFILAARTAGRVPLVTIEPWTTVAGNVLLDTGVITDGRALNDAIIQRNAWAVKAHHPQTVLIRFAHEMELVGNYPWSQSDYASYVAAYRHYHDVFEYLGVTNVRWIWSPAGNANSSDYYPGDEYVDYIGVTVLSHGELAFKAGDLLGSSFATIFNDRYRVVSGYEKPIIVAEMGVFPALAVESSDTYKAAWLKAAFAVFPDYPLLHGVVYFNAVNAPTNSEWGRPDWRIGADMLWRPEEMPELK